jgi:hypothetical protein
VRKRIHCSKSRVDSTKKIHAMNTLKSRGPFMPPMRHRVSGDNLERSVVEAFTLVRLSHIIYQSSLIADTRFIGPAFRFFLTMPQGRIIPLLRNDMELRYRPPARRIHHCNLLKARVKITPDNEHRSALFSEPVSISRFLERISSKR